jgi:integrase
MKIHSRKKVSYSWRQAVQIAEHIQNMSQLRERERYAVMVLLDAASGVRPGELLALRLNDIDFKASTIRVDEALPRKGQIGPCKNAAAYRTVLLRDAEGKRAMRELKRFLKGKDSAPDTLLFRTKRGGLIQETMMLRGNVCIRQLRL